MFKYIDISTHQKNVDYESVKNAGIQGVILRAGHTGSARKTMAKDELFETHYAGFKRVGLPIVGVYWYSRATTLVEAYNEAKLCLKIIEGKDIKTVFFDTEDNVYQAKLSKGALTSVALEFLETVKKAGYRAGFYSYISYVRNRYYMDSFKDYLIWMAQYYHTLTYQGKVDIWQYTSSGKVAGIRGKVDMNHAYVDLHSDFGTIPETPSTKKKYLYLSKAARSWRIYPLNQPAIVGKEIGKLAPAKFGGLKYEILETLPNNVYVIKTQTYGKVKIWAGKGSLATIKEE